jgi:hypothetical protein
MTPIIGAGFLAFFIASLVVGVRLVLLWRRTRELPELLIGIGVLGIGPIGFSFLLIGSLALKSGNAEAWIAFALGQLAVFVGVLAKSIFNWRVYHPKSSVARGVVALMALILVGLYIQLGWTRGFVLEATPGIESAIQSLLQTSALLWGAAESIRYWRLMRKRGRLGLADPVVTNRFLLWGIGAGAAGLGVAVGAVASHVLATPSLQIPWVIASSSAHGMVAAIAMSLAFVPPNAYLRWLRRNADAMAA